MPVGPDVKVAGSGFASHLTVGSQLLVKLPIGKGSIVEVRGARCACTYMHRCRGGGA